MYFVSDLDFAHQYIAEVGYAILSEAGIIRFLSALEVAESWAVLWSIRVVRDSKFQNIINL